MSFQLQLNNREREVTKLGQDLETRATNPHQEFRRLPITTEFVLSRFVDSLTAEKLTTVLRTCKFLGIVTTLTPINYGSKDF